MTARCDVAATDQTFSSEESKESGIRVGFGSDAIDQPQSGAAEAAGGSELLFDFFELFRFRFRGCFVGQLNGAATTEPDTEIARLGRIVRGAVNDMTGFPDAVRLRTRSGTGGDGDEMITGPVVAGIIFDYFESGAFKLAGAILAEPLL
jgi:hypothetical protein